MGSITLVLGGIKCGKTRYAEGKALTKESHGGEILYLATAEALDDEMKQRITRHQKDRPDNWTTVEEPLNINSVFEKYGDKYDLILLDCLTLWLTNKLGQAGDDYNREELMDSITDDCIEFLETSIHCNADLVIVSNQAELGLISSYSLGRLFQDLTGLLHQKIASYADNVIVLQAGIPTAIKGAV